MLPVRGSRLTQGEIITLQSILEAAEFDVQLRAPSIDGIRASLVEAAVGSWDILSPSNDFHGRDSTDRFIDQIFESDLLVEMSPRKKEKLDAALGKVMAS
jgi:hypothetical protein